MRPKLVFFQWKYDPQLPAFLLNHARDHVRCLENFFDVTVINDSCDYHEVCDRYEPDIVVFESGLDNITCQKPIVTNVKGNTNVPKVALHNADSFSGARAGFNSDIFHLGIEAIFAIATTAAEHNPELANDIFAWPNFIDPAVFHDYGERKDIPVLLTGNRTTFYPWRQKVFRLLSEHFPSLYSPHPGYESGSSLVQFMVGENYARTINSASLVPACGTIAREIVRKHFEIPGCRSCLVAEKTAALEAAGFVDMENCVFADEHDVVDKLSFLFKNPDKLSEITNAGHNLVHSRHTLAQRDEIRQWFDLRRDLKPGQRVIQPGLFQALRVVDTSAADRHSNVAGNGVHLRLIASAREKLGDNHYDEAKLAFSKCLNYMNWLPEARLGLTLCDLNQGDAKKAASWIEPNISYVLEQYGAVDPDPVEWAYYIVCLLSLGRLDAARDHAERFPKLIHPELDRVRWVTALLRDGRTSGRFPAGREPRSRKTLHPQQDTEPRIWLERLCKILESCKQSGMADTLRKADLEGTDQFERPFADETSRESHPAIGTFAGINLSPHKSSLRRTILRLRSRARKSVAHFLHSIEREHGYFLPYRLSEKKNDDFYRALHTLGREEDIATALIVLSAGQNETCREALLQGVLESQNDPAIFCLTTTFTKTAINHKRRLPSHTGVNEYEVFATPTDLEDRIEQSVRAIEREHQLSGFDVVLIGGSGFRTRHHDQRDIVDAIRGAKTILLDNINASNFVNHQRLMADSSYVLVADDPSLRRGYSIFRRRS
jgi:tetratricopeptide (TPR) repeat protein